MQSVLDVLQLATGFLKQKGVSSARRVAERLLEEVLGIHRVGLYMQSERPLEEGEIKTYREFILRAARHEPWQQIVGRVEFFGASIHVTPSVLIPRQETEIMLDSVCSSLKSGMKGLIAWDICTGSGCLGIALKKARPEIHVTLADVSAEALEVAKKNASHNRVDVDIVQGDLLAPFAGKKADLILCNPPYVTEEEYAHLERSVKEYEPKEALVGGGDGLAFYRRLSKDLPRALTPGGKVYFEIGMGQAGRLKEVFHDPMWVKREIRQDFSGKDRFFFLEYR